MNELKYQVISDEEIEMLFEYTNFGEATNNCIKLKRAQIVKSLGNKRDKYWVGHTMFRILVNAGLVNDFLKCKKVTLTMRGELFLNQELAN